jgi:apolipoprotein N-acyltransferase
MHHRWSYAWRSGTALISGALLTLSFAPFQHFWLAPLCVAWLAILWSHTTAWRGAWYGALFGIGFFATSIYWVFISIHEYGGTAVPIALTLTVGLIALMASYLAIQGWVLNRWWPHPDKLKLLVAFPASWVLMEWVRGWLFTGFPWMMLGYSQITGPLGGYAPVIGSYGVSALIALLAGVIAYLWWRRARYTTWQWWVCASLLLLIPLVGWYLQSIDWTRPARPPVTASLVQGNIAQTIKWSPEHTEHSMSTYAALSAPHWHSDLLIWPESSIPLPLDDVLDFLQPLVDTARATDTALLIGIPVDGARWPYFYNALVGFGAASGHYYKRHLVPFGEYIPFERWLGNVFDVLGIPIPGFMAGERGQALIEAGGIPIAAFICYEIAYAGTVRQALPAAQLLVTVSNDAWFGDSLAPYQHLEIAQMRSLQTGRDQLFATNDGITASIDARGRIIDAIPQFETLVLTTTVQPRVGATPWVILGDTPWLWLMLILLFGSAMMEKRRHD